MTSRRISKLAIKKTIIESESSHDQSLLGKIERRMEGNFDGKIDQVFGPQSRNRSLPHIVSKVNSITRKIGQSSQESAAEEKLPELANPSLKKIKNLNNVISSLMKS